MTKHIRTDHLRRLVNGNSLRQSVENTLTAIPGINHTEYAQLLDLSTDHNALFGEMVKGLESLFHQYPKDPLALEDLASHMSKTIAELKRARTTKGLLVEVDLAMRTVSSGQFPNSVVRLAEPSLDQQKIDLVIDSAGRQLGLQVAATEFTLQRKLRIPEATSAEAVEEALKSLEKIALEAGMDEWGFAVPTQALDGLAELIPFRFREEAMTLINMRVKFHIPTTVGIP
jgi:hypothetical protein